MEQRPLRLGDIVDDYCPRERRITNHAIVAIVQNSIRQTRCTTCDAEHVYKEAKVPRRKKTAEDLAGGQLVAPRDEPDEAASPVAEDVESAPNPEPEPAVAGSEPAGVPAPVAASADTPAVESESPGPETESGPAIDDSDAWPAHRTLIRATLPRVEGEAPPPRPIPEFTMHQRQTRGGNQFRQGGQGRQGQNGQGRNGNRQARSGHGHGNANGNVAGNGNPNGNTKGSGRSGRGRRNRGGQHKRSR